MSALPASSPVAIDPARLAPGVWCHRSGRQQGEGDIHASYSADCIGMDKPLRPPFRWQGGLWVCTSMGGGGRSFTAEAYRLLPVTAFVGKLTTYAEKTRDSDAARADPNGFYHGMTVRHAGALWVLSGPPVSFVPGEVEQMSLW